MKQLLSGSWDSEEGLPGDQDATERQLQLLTQRFSHQLGSTVAYRSLLYYLCENNQAIIDACIDHFIRDRAPTTTHQFIAYIICRLGSRIVLSTNFDPLLERALELEGVRTSVYEIQGGQSLPSIGLMLSQELSVVKLHGGAHQMQMGFDLDEPLSRSALSSFYELYDRLGDESGEQQPLTVVIGYSGGDRRVMDIVSERVRAWRNEEAPNVLWINRWPKPPKHLDNAIAMRKQYFCRASGSSGSGGRTPESTAGNREVIPANEPALHVHYRDARLFAADVFQALSESLPPAQSFYQAMNDSPHPSIDKYKWEIKTHEKAEVESATDSESTRVKLGVRPADDVRGFDSSPLVSAGSGQAKISEPGGGKSDSDALDSVMEPKPRSDQRNVSRSAKGLDSGDPNPLLRGELDPRNGLVDWTCCIIDGVESAGTSSHLASLCESHEDKHQSVTLWVDMEHCDTFASFMDYLAQRLAKYDSRLPRLVRPLCLETVPSPYSSVRRTGASPELPEEIGEHELDVAIGWVQHALRRGSYILALDSLEGFGHVHPIETSTLATTAPEKDPKTRRFEQELGLLHKFLARLIRDRSSGEVADLGLSRLAIANTTDPAADRDPAGASEAWSETFEKILGQPRDRHTHDIRAWMVSAEKTYSVAMDSAAKPAQPDETGDEPVQSPAAPYEVWRRLTIASSDSVTLELNGAEWREVLRLGRATPSGEQHSDDQCPSEVKDPAWLTSVIYLISVACRRERSNVLIQRTTIDLLRLIGASEQSMHSGCTDDFSQRGALSVPNNHAGVFQEVLDDETSAAISDRVWEQLELTAETGRVSTHAPVPREEYLKVRIWHERLIELSTKGDQGGPVAGLPRMHWREGGFTWLPQPARNRLYVDIAERHPALVTWTHHLIADYYLELVYARSHDARAFIEYIVHQRAAIAQALKVRKTGLAIQWLARLAAIIERERATLLVRAPMPKLVTEVNCLTETIAGAFRDREITASASIELIQLAARSLVLILDCLGNVLTACGHPNHALQAHARRIRLLGQDELYDLGDDTHRHALAQTSEQLRPAESAAQLISASLQAPLDINELSNEESAKEEFFKDLAGSKRLESFVRRDHVGMLRAMMDFADTLTAPLLFDTAGRQRAEQLWTKQNEHLEQLSGELEVNLGQLHTGEGSDRVAYVRDSKVLQGLQERRTREHRIADAVDTRQRRGELAQGALRRCMKQMKDWAFELPPRLQAPTAPLKTGGPTWRGPSYFSDSKLALLPMCQRRCLEHELLSYDELYLCGLSLYCEATQREQVKEQETAGRAGSRSDQEKIESRYVPLFQYCSQRYRHECYRLCLTARIEQGVILRLTSKKDDGEKAIEFDESFPLLMQRFEAAEAGLDRGLGPSDNQALAMTRLLRAELCVRRAELWVAARKDLRDSADAGSEIAERWKRGISNGRAVAERLLASANSLLPHGRGENRWRFLYSLIKARHQLVTEVTLDRRDFSGRFKAIYSAASHLHSAQINCGLLTDRRIVLDLWFGAAVQRIHAYRKDRGTDIDGVPGMDPAAHLLSWLGQAWAMGTPRQEAPATPSLRSTAVANKRSVE